MALTDGERDIISEHEADAQPTDDADEAGQDEALIADLLDEYAYQTARDRHDLWLTGDLPF